MLYPFEFMFVGRSKDGSFTQKYNQVEWQNRAMQVSSIVFNHLFVRFLVNRIFLCEFVWHIHGTVKTLNGFCILVLGGVNGSFIENLSVITVPKDIRCTSLCTRCQSITDCSRLRPWKFNLKDYLNWIEVKPTTEQMNAQIQSWNETNPKTKKRSSKRKATTPACNSS